MPRYEGECCRIGYVGAPDNLGGVFFAGGAGASEAGAEDIRAFAGKHGGNSY